MSKGWLEELVHEKYGLVPTDKAQQAIIEIDKYIKQLEDAGIRVVEMTYLIDESMDEKDMNNLLDSINALEKAVEQK